MAINSRAIIRRAPRGNKTEQRYADRLELLRIGDEIHRWDFEPVKLRLADKTYYTPDFRVILNDGTNQKGDVMSLTEAEITLREQTCGGCDVSIGMQAAARAATARAVAAVEKHAQQQRAIIDLPEITETDLYQHAAARLAIVAAAIVAAAIENEAQQ